MSHARFSRPLWHLVDARQQVLCGCVAFSLLCFACGSGEGRVLALVEQVVGRLAVQIARVLQGKHKPTYSPNYDCGDYVVVVNAAEVKFTGKKWQQKTYYWHTGYPGGLKQRGSKEQLAKQPEEVLRHAVLGMLPKTRLRKRMALKLRIFPGEKHLHEDKIPAGSPSILG